MESLQFRREIRRISTLVVKVGSRILTSGDNVPNTVRIRGLVNAIARLRQSGVRTVLVSSGAIAQGMRALRLERRPKSIPMKRSGARLRAGSGMYYGRVTGVGGTQVSLRCSATTVV